MSQGELNYRSRVASQIEENSPHGEAGQAIRRYSASLLRAMPLPDYFEQYRKLGELVAEASPRTTMEDGKLALSPRHELQSAQRQLKEENNYPRMLREAAERRLTGRPGYHTELSDSEIDSMLGLQGEPMAKAKTELEIKQQELLREIRAWKARVGQ